MSVDFVSPLIFKLLIFSNAKNAKGILTVLAG